MPLSRETLSGAIEAEIMRVSRAREALRRAAQESEGVGGARPMLYLMDQAVHFAARAKEAGDHVEMAVTLRALRDIKE